MREKLRDRRNGLFSDHAQWEQAVQDAEERMDRLEQLRGRVAESSALLHTALQAYEQLAALAEEIFVHGQLAADLEPENEEAHVLFAACEQTALEIEERTAFVQEEIAELPEELATTWFAAEPGLTVYLEFVQQVRKEGSGGGLGLEGLPRFEEVFSSLFFVDMKIPPVESPSGEWVQGRWGRYRSLMSTEDRAFRQRLYSAAYQSFRSFGQTFAALYNGHVHQETVVARINGHRTAFQAAQEQNRMEEGVREHLLTNVRAHLPLLHRSMRLQKRKLGLDSLALYDLNVSLLRSPHRPIPLERKREILRASLKPLGDSYLQRLERAWDHVWSSPDLPIQYTTNVYNRHPIVLIRTGDTLHGLLTLAHELGHAIQMQYTNESQPYFHAKLHEIPSELTAIVHEQLVLKWCIEQAEDDSLRQEALQALINKYQSVLYRQSMLTEFEQAAFAEVEKGNVLTASHLAQEMTRLQGLYYGADLMTDDLSGYDFVRVHHLYMSFYLYAYPIAFACAQAIVEQVSQDGEAAAAYERFLRTASAEKPCDAMRGLGLDLLDEKVYRTCFDKFAETLDRAERDLVNEID